tara:strand:- start:84 stop:770 length:687 start_codon:yes stop_codon:yes gene_type:complete
MKKIFLSAILAISGVGFAAPAMSVFTINTSDPVAYMEWARGSGKALAEINNVVSSGVCQPGYGAEEFGDMYYWSLFENHADSIGGNTVDPVYIREISKIASKRTIREVDHYSVLTEASGSFETGQTFANYNINVKTKNPAAYLNAISEYQALAQANGFEDITLEAYQINTGDYTGQMMVVIQGPTPQRLGAFLDSRNENWGQSLTNQIQKLRYLKRGFIMNCEVNYAR